MGEYNNAARVLGRLKCNANASFSMHLNQVVVEMCIRGNMCFPHEGNHSSLWIGLLISN